MKFWNTAAYNRSETSGSELGARDLDICGRDDLFSALHLILSGNFIICERDELSFCSFDFGRNLNICGRDDLFFCTSLDFGRNFITCGRDDFFFALHVILGGI